MKQAVAVCRLTMPHCLFACAVKLILCSQVMRRALPKTQKSLFQSDVGKRMTCVHQHVLAFSVFLLATFGNFLNCQQLHLLCLRLMTALLSGTHTWRNSLQFSWRAALRMVTSSPYAFYRKNSCEFSESKDDCSVRRIIFCLQTDSKRSLMRALKNKAMMRTL